MLVQLKKYFPYSLLKYAEILVQSINPIFWVRALKSAIKCWHLLIYSRVVFDKYESKNGLSAIIYLTGDISIFILEGKMDDLDSTAASTFNADLQDLSHTITLLPSVIITWIGQVIGLFIYFKWIKINELINTINQLL